MLETSNAPAAQPTTEVWRPASDSHYEVSSLGRIRRSGRVLRLSPNSKGYVFVDLRGRSCRVAGEVALAFLGPRPVGLEINHKNGVKTDNRVENLEYVTRGENLRHAHAMRLRSSKGERNGNARLTEMLVRVIRRLDLPNATIGRLVGVGTTAVWNVRHGRSWRSV